MAEHVYSDWRLSFEIDVNDLYGEQKFNIFVLKPYKIGKNEFNLFLN